MVRSDLFDPYGKIPYDVKYFDGKEELKYMEERINGISHQPGRTEANAYFAEVDASLPDELKQCHPLLSWEEINQCYQDQWIAIQTFAIDDIGEVAKGRVFASALNPDTVQQVRQALRRSYPRLVLINRYLGEIVDRGQIIA